MTIYQSVITFSILCACLSGCGVNSAPTEQNNNSDANDPQVPASAFDLEHWKLTIPVDKDRDGVSDVIDAPELQSYSHPEFFYLDKNKHMVFATPNKAATERTSTNTRSEFRYMNRGKDLSIAEGSPQNNFALSANKNAQQFPSIGRKLEATLHVDHVSRNAGYPNKPPAFSVVIGQVHALHLSEQEQTHGLGWGNEPLKISYKKWPNHEKGSVYWTYERNLATNDPNRIDIAYSVWGSNWDDPTDPQENGIALGESFSYTVNIYQNIMYLTFTSAKQGTVHHKINLANNIDANGEIDEADYALGYKDETLFFKAGAYNQCSTKDVELSFRYPACAGSGDWQTDVSNGDYAQVTFSKLVVSAATPE